MDSVIIVTAKLLQMPLLKINGNIATVHLKRAKAILYYMLLHKKVSREELSTLIWPNEGTDIARSRLRDNLYSIKKDLSIHMITSIGREYLQLNPEIKWECDVDSFLQTQSVHEYNGLFLQGFYLNSSAEFEAWLRDKREEFRTEYLRRLIHYASSAYFSSEYLLAEQYIAMSISEDPFNERAVILAMKVYRELHDYNKVAHCYQKYQRLLADELGITPLKDTSTLYYDIMRQWNDSVSESIVDSSTLLIERHRLYQTLQTDFKKVQDRQVLRFSVVVQGESGVGKTHVLNYFLSQTDLSDYYVINVSCYKSKIDEPLYSWQSIILSLSSYIASETISIPEQYLQSVSQLFPALGKIKEAKGNPDNLAILYISQASSEAFLTILSLITAAKPLLLVIEDIQWMDEKSIRLLDQVIRHIEPHRFYLLTTCHKQVAGYIDQFLSVAESDRIISRYTLLPLSIEETNQLVELLCRYPLSDTQKNLLFHNTGGNAFLMVQILENINENGVSDAWIQTMDNILKYRISSFSLTNRQILDLIAIFPEAAPYEVLREVSHKKQMELLYICQELQNRLIIQEHVEGDNLLFTFPQSDYREWIYKHIPATNKRILHLNIADVLSHYPLHHYHDLHAQIAYHYERGGRSTPCLSA